MNLAVYDVQGSHLRTIVNENMAPGEYTAQWDGINERDIPAASGVYFYRRTINEQHFGRTGKMILLR